VKNKTNTFFNGTSENNETHYSWFMKSDNLLHMKKKLSPLKTWVVIKKS
jgi:hypothetical protein